MDPAAAHDVVGGTASIGNTVARAHFGLFLLQEHNNFWMIAQIPTKIIISISFSYKKFFEKSL